MATLHISAVVSSVRNMTPLTLEKNDEIQCKLWNSHTEMKLKVGQRVLITNVVVDIFRDTATLNINNFTKSTASCVNGHTVL